jgi:RNA recognition motif-containing protein
LKSRKIVVNFVKRNLEEYNPKSIFVSNINPTITEMELGKFFEKYGDVNTVKILISKNESNFSTGFVNFNDT